MSILDKVKETAGKVTDKAKEGVEVGKEKVGDLKTKREIDSLYQEIGALTVAKQRGDAPTDVETRISTKVSEALELEKKSAQAPTDTATPTTTAPEPAISLDDDATTTL
jgi:hypothetical protein